MRTLSAIFTLAAVVSFAVVPYYTDWHPHYLGDRTEQVGSSSGEGSANGSVHYKDCHWLAGTSGVQATITFPVIVFGSEDFSPWIPATPRPCFSSFPSAFSSRAPPTVLS